MKGTLRHYGDGEIIFQENDPGTEVYILRQGRIDLVKQVGNGSLQLAQLGAPGELFGEMAAFDAGRRSATARAHGAVTVEVLEHDRFLATLERDPDLALSVMRKLVARLRDTDELLVAQAAARRPAPEVARRGGLLKRLFGTGRDRPAAATPTRDRATVSADLLHQRHQRDFGTAVVQVADFAGDDGSARDQVFEALGGHHVLVPVPLMEPLGAAAPADEAAFLAVARRARERLAQASRGTLVLWGRVAEDRLTVHFYPALPEAQLRSGGFGLFSRLVLPRPVTPQAGRLLAASCLAAAVPQTGAQLDLLHQWVPGDVNDARSQGLIPAGLAPMELAMALECYGAIQAVVGYHDGGGGGYRAALAAFRAALDCLGRAADDLDWGRLKRQISAVSLVLGEREQDAAMIDAAVADARLALEAFSPEITPWNRAMTQERLGLALYKAGAPDCDAVMLQEALDNLQAALSVFTETAAPHRWAELTHNLGSLLQLLGARFHRRDVLEWAVESCRAAMRVRQRETYPLLWAATQNNLGAALYLLFKEAELPQVLEEAQKAFRNAQVIYQAFGMEGPARVAETNLQRLEGYAAATPAEKDWFLIDDDEEAGGGDDR